jgi:hypothetical protein
MHKSYLLLLFCLAHFGLSAQIGTSNTIESTDSMQVWSCNDIDPYSYIPLRLTNISPNNLNVVYRLSPIQPARFPSQWHVMIEVANGLGYTDSLSGDFKLNADGSGARTVSVVVYPNGQSGHDTLRLVLHPDTDPTDTLEIFYIITVNNTLSTNSIGNLQLSAMQIAPNPTKGNIRISSDSNEASEIYIYNLMGQIVFRQNVAANALKNGYNIELPQESSAGIYQLHLRNNNGKTIANKSFIKI